MMQYNNSITFILLELCNKTKINAAIKSISAFIAHETRVTIK